jgi:hypothetical protein
MQGQLCSRLPMTLSLLLLGDAALAYDRSKRTATTRLLSGHVITPVIVPTQLMVNGMSVGTTPVRTTLAATVETNSSSSGYKVNNATIVTSNALVNNSIIHALSFVFVVPGAEYPPQNSTTSSDPSASPSKARHVLLDRHGSNASQLLHSRDHR